MEIGDPAIVVELVEEEMEAVRLGGDGERRVDGDEMEAARGGEREESGSNEGLLLLWGESVADCVSILLFFG